MKKGETLMTLSMFEIMARIYQDKELEPPPMPATIQAMRRAYTDICQGEDPWTAWAILPPPGTITRKE